MDLIMNENLQTVVRPETDVIVAGGGIAGVAAALAARRNGAKCLLLEKTAAFGGLATNGLINWYEPLCNGKGVQLMYGLAEELLRLSIQDGDDTLPKIWRDRSQPIDPDKVEPAKQHPVGGRYASYFSPTLFQMALDELLLKEGVQIRLDIQAVRPVTEGKRIRGICCESKSGREFFPCKTVVDATGDCDLFLRAGYACREGENFFTAIAHVSDLSPKEKAMKLRRWMACGADLHGVGQPEGEPFTLCRNNEEETSFLLRSRAALLEKVRKQPKGSMDVVALPGQAQVRKTYAIKGAYTLSEADRCQKNARSVGLCCDFEIPGDWYEIPWDCLYIKGCENMLAAGRMISASGWAWDVTRVIPVCALTGQAAGTAAAMMQKERIAAETLDIGLLQHAMKAQGVLLHFSEAKQG